MDKKTETGMEHSDIRGEWISRLGKSRTRFDRIRDQRELHCRTTKESPRPLRGEKYAGGSGKKVFYRDYRKGKKGSLRKKSGSSITNAEPGRILAGLWSEKNRKNFYLNQLGKNPSGGRRKDLTGCVRWTLSTNSDTPIKKDLTRYSKKPNKRKISMDSIYDKKNRKERMKRGRGR